MHKQLVISWCSKKKKLHSNTQTLFMHALRVGLICDAFFSTLLKSTKTRINNNCTTTINTGTIGVVSGKKQNLRRKIIFAFS